MALHFIFGASGAGKSYYIYNKIIEESMKNPEKQYLVLVPEQFTMQTQKEMVTLHPRKGILNIDVLSFERLAYRVFEETGETCAKILEETGKSLVLRKVAQEKKKELGILGEKMKKQGYVSSMKSMVSELKQYEITNEDMDAMLAFAQDKPELYYKLKDIAVLYKGFSEYLEGKFITSEEVLDVLGNVAERSKKICGSTLVLDGYTGFTPVQKTFLERILPLVEEVYVTVTMDDREDPYQPGSPHKLFYLSKETVRDLCRIAQKQGVMIRETWIRGTARFKENPALNFLEKNLFRYHKAVYKGENTAVRIWESRNPAEETEEIVCMIHYLVRTGGYRFRDFAVITGDLETYGDHSKRIFKKYGIPCFVDRKTPVFMNPFVEFLRSGLDILLESYSYTSMFRFLRCGLTDLKREDIDVLENYVLGMGIRSKKKWNEAWVRHYKGEDPEEVPAVEEIRKEVIALLQPFSEEMKPRKATVRERAEAFYKFILTCRIEEKLLKEAEKFKEKGMTEKAREYEQIYPMVMELFDKMVEILGGEKVSVREFKELLEAGLTELQTGTIPPGTDQVLVGDMERTRLKDIKILFFAGVNDGKIPRDTSGGKILSDLNRETLKGSSVTLAPSSRDDLYTQRFYLYLSMTKPSEGLYLSCSRSSDSGEAMTPSFLMGAVARLFPGLVAEFPLSEEEKACESPENALSCLAEGFRKILSEEPSLMWQELFSWYLKQEKFQETMRHMTEGAFLVNPEDRIGKSTARALYGTTLENSATRLELFARCACAHFMTYGLELKERASYEFSPMDMGNVLHGGLERFAGKLHDKNMSWTSLSEEQMKELSDKCIDEITADYGNTILQSSARNEYMVNRLKRMMNRTVWALADQIGKGDFSPEQFEVSFAMADSLDSVNIDLSEDEKIKLLGRIDRVDTCEKEDKVLVKVIDYKSGNTSFDLLALYYGLQLQLVLYMNAAMELEQKSHPGKEVVPAGIFYYNIKDPVVDLVEGEQPEDINARILKELKMNGVASSDRETLIHLDHGLQKPGSASSVVPVTLNKDDTISKSSNAISPEQFQIISGYVTKKIKEIGRNILDGDAGVEPFELGRQNACTYCPYRGVCGFDEKVPGYQFRRLKKLDSEEIWKNMDHVEKEV